MSAYIYVVETAARRMAEDPELTPNQVVLLIEELCQAIKWTLEDIEASSKIKKDLS